MAKRGRKPNKITESVLKQSILNNDMIFTRGLVYIPKLKEIEPQEVRRKKPSNCIVNNLTIIPTLDKTPKKYIVSEVNDTRNEKGLLCHNCCHKFNSPVVHLPIRRKNNRFEVRGNFCSFNCVKSYTIDYRLIKSLELLPEYSKYILGKRVDIKKAPSKLVLESFGGTVSIEDYRNSFTYSSEIDYTLGVNPFIFVVSQIEKKYTTLVK